jgi:DNA-binding NarL/FixJ family response regulator
MTSPKRITIVLAEDHEIVREGLRSILESESDIEVIGEASNGREALELTLKLRPDVVVMDIAMPQLNGLEATRQICKTLPDAKVLILSAHSDDAYVENVTAYGAVGYLIKQTSAHFLSEAIREVVKGNTYFSASIDKRHTQRHQMSLDSKGELKPKSVKLSPRETEVLQLVAEGEANKQIAGTLGISIKTVEKHRQNLMMKLNIHDTAGLTRYAISEGTIENSVQLTIIDTDVDSGNNPAE